MTSKELEQIRSYSKLIVYELHKAVFDEAIFDKLKATLLLAEEMECFVEGLGLINVERPTERNNIIQFRKAKAC
jgi:hypothetical protein